MSRRDYAVRVDGETYVPLWAAAAILDRKYRSLQFWAQAGQIRSEKISGALYVHLDDAARRSRDTPRRQRKPQVAKR